MSEFSLRLVFVSGVLNLMFTIFHMMFWQLFKWKDELAKISAENRGIMQVLNLVLIFVYIAAAYIAFFHGRELVQTQLGRTLLISGFLFWLLRAIYQPVFWGLNKISLAITAIFILTAAVKLVPAVWRG